MLKDMKILEAKLASAGMETFGAKSVGWGHYTIKLAPKAGGDPVVLEGRYMALGEEVQASRLFVTRPRLLAAAAAAPAPAKNNSYSSQSGQPRKGMGSAGWGWTSPSRRDQAPPWACQR